MTSIQNSLKIPIYVNSKKLEPGKKLKYVGDSALIKIYSEKKIRFAYDSIIFTEKYIESESLLLDSNFNQVSEPSYTFFVIILVGLLLLMLSIAIYYKVSTTLLVHKTKHSDSRRSYPRPSLQRISRPSQPDVSYQRLYQF